MRPSLRPFLPVLLPVLLFASPAFSGGLGIEAGIGISAPDLPDEPGLVLKPFASWEIGDSGFSIGVEEWALPLAPSFSWGSLEFWQDYTFNPGGSDMSLSFGNNNLFTWGRPVFTDGYLYAAWNLGLDGTDLLQLELNGIYLQSSQGTFGLGILLGLGYEWSFGKAGTLGLWTDFNFDLYKEPALGEIEASLSWTLDKNSWFISLALEPTIAPQEKWSLSLEPVLSAGLRF